MLEITFTRTGPRRYRTTVRRDGTVFELRGFDRPAELPHDLAHFVVERGVGCRHGFWGCVAAGANFQSMTLVEGRRTPHWTERSREVLRRHHDQLTEAESLVGLLLELFGEGIGNDDQALRRRLARRWTPPRDAVRLGPAEARRACQALADARDRWQALPTGGNLTVTWTDPPARPAGRDRGPGRRRPGRATAGRPGPGC
ncbi:MAG TPA: hypothetical protein VGA45_01690 [Actinomycetota bacterium]